MQAGELLTEDQEHSGCKQNSSMLKRLNGTPADIEQGKPLQVGKGTSPASPAHRFQAFVSKWANVLVAIAAVYAAILTLFLLLVRQLPSHAALSAKAQLPQETELIVKWPRDIAELRAVRQTILLYRSTYSTQIAVMLVLVYLIMTGLSIPGVILINLLFGSLYSLPLALATVAAVSTAGAYLNYELSDLLLKDMIIDLMPGKIASFHHSVERHRDNLLYFFVILRVTPLLPSWFINFASPIVNIDRRTFVLGTLIGAQPLNIISVSAGRTLSKLTSYRDLYSLRTLALLALCASSALLPVVLKRYMTKRSVSKQSLYQHRLADHTPVHSPAVT